MRRQYFDYCQVLSSTSLEEKLESMQIFRLLFDPKAELYKGIQGILSVVARAMVSMSVESVAEGWISILESHKTKARNRIEDTTLESLMAIAINGPEPAKCNSIVNEAQVIYWSKATRAEERDGHYVRRWVGAKNHKVSAVVDRLNKVTTKRGFLVE
jgi:hypothetical protein